MACLADIDDTISTSGRVTAEAYAAMERLRRAGLLVIPITGRPAGWCDHIARMWPVDAVVGENGALYMIHDDRARKLKKRYALGEADRKPPGYGSRPSASKSSSRCRAVHLRPTSPTGRPTSRSTTART